MRRVISSPVTRAAVLLVLLALAALELVHSWPDVHRDLHKLTTADIVLAVLFGLGPLFAGAMCWRTLLGGLGAMLPLRATLTAFSIGQLGKYLPGSVWPVVVQGELAREHGVRRDRAVTASLLAMGMSLVGSLLVAAVALPASGALPWWGDAGLNVLAIVLLVVVYPPVLSRLVGIGLRLLRRDPLPEPLGRRVVATALAWSLAGSLSLGLQAWVIGRALGPVDVGRAIGGFELAWLVGFVIPILPGGAGARELVLYALFGGPLTHTGAVALAAVSRLILTVIDIVAGVTAAIARPRRASVAPPVPEPVDSV